MTSVHTVSSGNRAMHFITQVTKAFILKPGFVKQNEEKCDAGDLFLFLPYAHLQVLPLPLGSSS